MALSKRGSRGRTGARGKVGLTGKTGPRGAVMKRSEILAIVADQFEEIRTHLDVQRKQLDLQLQRTAQIQAQLDHLASVIERIVNEDDRQLRRERALKIEHVLP